MTVRFKWVATAVAFGVAVVALTVWLYEGRLEALEAQRQVDLREFAKEAGQDFWEICQSAPRGVGRLAPKPATALAKAPFNQFVLDDPQTALIDGFSSVVRKTMSFCLLRFVGIDEAERLELEFTERFYGSSEASAGSTDPLKRAQRHFDAWQWYIDTYDARVTSNYVYRR